MNALFNEKEVRCLIAYANCNMVLSDTSRAVCYHPNSVRYHFDHVHKKTGLNPCNFYELHQLIEMCVKQESMKFLYTDDN